MALIGSALHPTRVLPIRRPSARWQVAMGGTSSVLVEAGPDAATEGASLVDGHDIRPASLRMFRAGLEPTLEPGIVAAQDTGSL